MNKKILDFKKNLTILILCGGKGLRLRPVTKDTPKPLIKIKNKSILENIIDYFLKFKIDDFIIATGYKHRVIEKFIRKKQLLPFIKYKPIMILEGDYHYKSRNFFTSFLYQYRFS